MRKVCKEIQNFHLNWLLLDHNLVSSKFFFHKISRCYWFVCENFKIHANIISMECLYINPKNTKSLFCQSRDRPVFKISVNFKLL